MRKLADGEFCSAEHRSEFQRQQNDLALARLIESQRRVERPTEQEKPKPKAKSGKAKDNRDESVPFAGYVRMALIAARSARFFVPAVSPLQAEQERNLPVDPARVAARGFHTGGLTGWLMVRPAEPKLRGLEPLFLIPDLQTPRYAAAPEFRGSLPATSLVALSSNGTAGAGATVPRFTSVWLHRGGAWTPAPPPGRLRTIEPEEWSEPSIPAPAGLQALALADAVRLHAAAARPGAWVRPELNPVLPAAILVPRQSELERTWEPKDLARLVRLRLSWPSLLCRPAAIRIAAPAGDQPMAGDSTPLLPAARFALRERALRRQRRGLLLPWPGFQAPRNAEVLATSVSAWAPELASLLPAPVAQLRPGCFPAATGIGLPAGEAVRTRLVLKVRLPRPVQPRAVAAGPQLRLPLAVPGLQSPGAPLIWADPSKPQADPREQIYRVSPGQPMEQFEMAASVVQLWPFAKLVLDSTLLDVILDRVEDTPAQAGEPVPPLRQRQYPVLMSRTPAEPAAIRELRAVGPLWDEMKRRGPKQPRTALCVDRPDGSGPKVVLPVAAKPARWKVGAGPLGSVGRFWRYAPADLKWIGVGLPLVLALVLYSTLGPSAKATSKAAPTQAAVSAGSGMKTILAGYMSNMKQNIGSRAAVNLSDDFRSGLGSWQGDGEWARTWNYTQSSFVEPGQLALYAPTVGMTDYSMEFLAQIGKRSLNWVFRAQDTKNYHAMRLVITKPGPLPTATLMRYTVINGKEGPVKTLPLPLQIRSDTVYRVHMEVRGNEFVTYVQDQVADHFSDERIPRGGVGFFNPKGDAAYLRWVEVSYQYDFLGRLCAMLTPYSVPSEGRTAE